MESFKCSAKNEFKSFQRYQTSLESEAKGNGDKLMSTIDLLSHTSKFIKIFSSMVPVRGLDDSRLKQLKDIQSNLSKGTA